jgi:hypothetical protein
MASNGFQKNRFAPVFGKYLTSIKRFRAELALLYGIVDSGHERLDGFGIKFYAGGTVSMHQLSFLICEIQAKFFVQFRKQRHWTTLVQLTLDEMITFALHESTNAVRLDRIALMQSGSPTGFQDQAGLRKLIFVPYHHYHTIAVL